VKTFVQNKNGMRTDGTTRIRAYGILKGVDCVDGVDYHLRIVSAKMPQIE